MELPQEPLLWSPSDRSCRSGGTRGRFIPGVIQPTAQLALSPSTHCLRIQVQTVYSREVFDRSSYRDKCLHLNIWNGGIADKEWSKFFKQNSASGRIGCQSVFAVSSWFFYLTFCYSLSVFIIQNVSSIDKRSSSSYPDARILFFSLVRYFIGISKPFVSSDHLL